MKKINLAISGCLGRMGQQLIKSSKSNKNFKLVALTENKIIKKKIAGIRLNLNTNQAFKNTDVIIDFTVPNCTLDILKIASKLKKRVVIGTTGFTQKEDDLIKRFSKKIPILLNKEQKELLEKFREIENEKSNPSIKKFFQKAKSFWKK